jgi:hypothetical protein
MTPAGTAGAMRSARWWVEACRAARARVARQVGCVDRYDLAAALLFATLVALVGFTFGDYAISNDEEVQQRYGELIIDYYRSGFVDQAVFQFRNLYLYGGLFDIAAVGLEKVVPLDTYAVRHILSALTGIGGLAAVWATARTIAGPRAGLLAAAMLAVCGTWYGTMFNHTKDIPFAAAMMAATYFLVRIGRELPRPRWHLVVLFGLFCGAALGIRVLGLFLIGYAGLVVVLQAPIGRAPWRDLVRFGTRSALPFAAAFVLAYVIMIAAWPWAGLAPLNPLRGLTTFVDFNYPIRTMLDGQVYKMADVPRWYVPTYLVIKLTLWLLVGAGVALVLALKPRRSAADNAATAANTAWRKQTALIACAACFPLLCEVIVRGPADTGLRHFLFIVPPIAVLAGLGVDGLLRRIEGYHRFAVAAGLGVVLVGLVSNATTLYRLHPDEYLFFNSLVGGLEGASRRYATDYWVNIMPEAVADLERVLDQTDRGSSRPRHYLVGVCGERLPFEKQADSRLEWTRDWSRAEFFIAPTHMNCDQALDGRVVATITRLGVVIGVVKDRRNVIHPNIARNH